MASASVQGLHLMLDAKFAIQTIRAWLRSSRGDVFVSRDEDDVALCEKLRCVAKENVRCPACRDGGCDCLEAGCEVAAEDTLVR